MRRTPVLVWTHPEALRQDVSILAEQGRIVSTLHEPWMYLWRQCPWFSRCGIIEVD
jgi:hypothetical protein